MSNSIPTERQLAARWVQYFQETLNQPNPVDLADRDPAPAGTSPHIDVGLPTADEVHAAIMTLKIWQSTRN